MSAWPGQTQHESRATTTRSKQEMLAVAGLMEGRWKDASSSRVDGKMLVVVGSMEI